MLRGAIDFSSPERIGGWIYSEKTDVCGHTVLAFLDGKCIGAGRVELFRKDLVDAGLGDGRLGFNFGISVPQLDDVERVVIKLDGSDLLLVQPSIRIERASAVRGGSSSLLDAPTTIEWMRSKGWLEQSEFDFLRFLSQVGAYDLSLRRTKAVERETGNALLDPLETARRLFCLIALEDIEPEERTISDPIEIAALARSSFRVAALWSSTVQTILVVEGSGNDLSSPAGEQLDGAVEYPCGPDRLLFLDLRTRFGVGAGGNHIGVRVFLAG